MTTRPEETGAVGVDTDPRGPDPSGDRPDADRDLALAGCINCGRRFEGRYCPGCGQPRRARFTLRRILRDTLSDLFDLDRGFGYTLLALSRRPGAAIREYVEGRTVRYTNPVKYLLIMVALGTVAYLQVGIFEAQVGELEGVLDEDIAARLDPVIALARTYYNVLLMSAIPFLIIGSRLLFRGAGHNLAEHSIFNIFVYAQQSFMFLLLLPAFALYPTSNLLTWGYIAVMAAYYVWACVDFFETGLAPATLKGLVISAFAYVSVFLLWSLAAAIYLGVVAGS